MILTGKRALVTGASQGIGKAVALELARKGCDIVLHYHHNIAEARTVAAEVGQLGVQAILLSADYENPESVAEMGQLAWEAFGSIDFLINNAGVSYKKHFLDLEMEDIDRFTTINFKSTLMLTQTILRNMVEQQVAGSVFTVTSVNALQPGVGLSAYGASKGALETLMKGAALEMAVHNIKINTVAVGAVQTAMTEAVWTEPGLLEQVNAAIPMKRLGKPEEVASVIVGLIAANTYMTGATITLDGGWMMGQGFSRPQPYGS